jgi:CRISPR/Cas system-associated exonuclease Cas4 (RecB family)
MKVKRTDDLLVKLDQRKADEIEAATGLIAARDFFRGSEVGHCSNEINFRRRGTEVKEIGVNKARFLDDGHLHQAVLSTEMKKAGIKVFGEEAEKYVAITHKGVRFKIKCHKDGSVLVGKEEQLLEVKSVKEERFAEVLKTSDVSQYYDQIQMYLQLFKYTKCKLVVVDRNHSTRQEFTIFKDKERILFLYNKLARIEEDISKGKPSPRDHNRTSKECGWCPYFEQCWGIPRGHRQKGEDERAVEVDGVKEQKAWDLAIDLYLKYARLKKEAKGYKTEADALMERLFKRFKATKLYGESGSVTRTLSNKQVPDKATIRELIIKGVIPFTFSNNPSIRYYVGNGEDEDDE